MEFIASLVLQIPDKFAKRLFGVLELQVVMWVKSGFWLPLWALMAPKEYAQRVSLTSLKSIPRKSPTKPSHFQDPPLQYHCMKSRM